MDIAVRAENQSGQRVGFVVAASERVEHAFGPAPVGRTVQFEHSATAEGTKVSQGPPPPLSKIAISVKD